MENYVQCAVRTCPNNSRKTRNRIQYFRFPRADDLLTLWTVRCDRLDTWTPSASFICSSHFTADDYVEVSPGISRLHPEAVPSKNLGYDWESVEREDVMLMEDNFTSEDDDTNDSIVRALMSMRDGSRLPNVTNPEINYPLTGTTFQSVAPTTSSNSTNRTQFNLNQSVPSTQDSNVIVVTDVRKKSKKPKQIEPNAQTVRPKQKNKLRDKYCVVPTCSARRGHDKATKTGFHYFPASPTERANWIRAIFYSDIYCKRNRFLCRRHFTTDDYLDTPKSGISARLRRGAIPSQNIPICEAESLLARKKLWMDLNRRKPEEKNLTFSERLAREPELHELLKLYMEQVSKIDPKRVGILPVIRSRGELLGPGEPCPGTGIRVKPIKKNKTKKTFEDFTSEEKAEYLAKKARQMEQRKEKRRLRYQIRAKRRKQLSEERKMKLFEEKLERLELRKTNPEAYHDLMAEERKTVWREKLAMKQKQKKVDQERLLLKMNDPEAYNKLLNKEREAIRKRITDAANTKNPVNFSNKIEIIAKDPEKGGKYKVVLKKVFPRKQDVKEDVISQLVSDKSRPIEIVQNVVKEIDFSKTKRVKFAEADKLTKISNQRSMEIPKLHRPKAPSQSKVTERMDAATCTADGPAVVVEPMITFDDFSEEPLQNVTDDNQDDHQDDHHLDDDHFDDNADPFEGISDNENFLEDATDGYDHSYTNKTLQPNEDTVSKDPFEELRDQLRSLPESEARALVRDKMDAYKETFKKQMTRIRAIIQAKKKVDRKVKMLTRTLCLSLREQYVKYYKN